jgi:hypothetical protein
MIALARLRPYLQVMLPLALVALLLAVGFRVLDATPILGWLPKAVSGTGFLEDNRDRVAGASREYREGRVAPGEYLCVIMGLSNVREGVLLDTVAAEAALPCRYLGLGGAGVGMPGLHQHAQALLASDLRPDLVLVGIGPHQMVDTRPKPQGLQQGVIAYLRQGDLRNAAISARNWCWFYARRDDVTRAIEATLLDARASLFRLLDVQLQEPEHRSPWRGMIRKIDADHFSEATLQEEEQFCADLGVYDEDTYAKAEKAPEVLIHVVDELRARGSVVVIVLMPENSRLRNRMPPNALEAATTPLRLKYGDEMPPILDLRDAIGDSCFVDLAHLNRAGAEKCSRLLGENLHRFLPSRPPLMQDITLQQ